MGKRRNLGSIPSQKKLESDERIVKFQGRLDLVQATIGTFGGLAKVAIIGYFSHAVIQDIAGKTTKFAFFTNLPALIGLDLSTWVGYFLAILFLSLFLMERKLRKAEIQKNAKMNSELRKLIDKGAGTSGLTTKGDTPKN